MRWAVDWTACFVLLVLYRGILHNSKDGFRQQFSLDDVNIQHPHAKVQHVPESLLAQLAVAMPLIAVTALSLLMKKRWARLNTGWLGFAMTIVITGCITELGKSIVGRPRPDLLARCDPMHGSIPTSSTHYKSSLVDYTICRTPISTHTLTDGFKSFPSGHSSIAFAGLTFLAWYMHGCSNAIVRKFARPHEDDEYNAPTEQPVCLEEGQTLPPTMVANEPPQFLVVSSLLMPLLPILLAAYIALSRLMDYRHHPTDVLAGSILGATTATIVYHIYHHSRTIKA